MGLSKIILNIALSIVNVFTFYLRPIPNRITFISLTSDKLTSDFKRIYKALEKENVYELRCDLVVFQKSLWGDFLYFLNCLKQLVEIKRSALVIINDNNYVISHMKPKRTKVLQVWHACGAVKKFGNQIRRQYVIRNYDAVISSAPYWKECYAQAFGVMPGQVYDCGMARTDNLLDQKKMNRKIIQFYEKYPDLKEKKCILYAPTFRGNIIDGFEIESLDLDKMAEELEEDTVVLYKFHPLLGDVRFRNKKAVAVNTEDLYVLMQISTCLISDYSSIIFDYSLLKKPMIAYVSDLEQYKKTIGLNIPYEQDFPGEICFTEKNVIDAIRRLPDYNYEKLYEFQKKYIIRTDGNNTSRIVKLIHELTNIKKGAN